MCLCTERKKVRSSSCRWPGSAVVIAVAVVIANFTASKLAGVESPVSNVNEDQSEREFH